MAKGVSKPGFLKDNGLSLAYLALFLATFWAQSLAGWLSYNEEQRVHSQHEAAYAAYLGKAHFWQAVGENWQSEFLAVFSMVTLSIFLRQKGSRESKPVAAAHSETGR
jgi:hypothetical protein